jgi:class 3 adenylate cyclase/tetratricopeptide (TPR) repeat protein
MLCPNCQTLNPVNAKFCLECGNRLIACTNCGTVNLPIAKFCIECGTALRAKSSNSNTGTDGLIQVETDTATNEDRASRPRLTLLPPPEERRVVTVMFADITGSTPLADRLDPEDMRAILTGYFNLMAEQIRKHGGTVEKYIGDAVMAVFGVPVAHEDDPDRAIRAALDMQAALTRFNEQRLSNSPTVARLQMRIGINTGEVAAPGDTTPQRQDFLITGDAVNIAARLQQSATPDTILVGERTYLNTRDMFTFQTIAPLRLKGKPEPVGAHVVLGLRTQTPAIPQRPRGIVGRQAPLVGRSLELTLLHANYARVQAESRPHLITILGSSGIGKSRLVREFIAREQERARSASSTDRLIAPLVLKGRCPPYGEGITYWPLIEILRSLLDRHEDESDAELQARLQLFVRDLLTRTGHTESSEEIATNVLRRIGRNINNTSNNNDINGLYLNKEPRWSTYSTHNTAIKQNGQQIALLRAWRVLLEALAEVQPLIVVIDDLQWADEALLEFLEYLSDRIMSAPILFLCPARPDFFERRRDWGGGKRNFTTIELEALSREESSELVDALLNSNDLPEVLRNTILARAEGNPFFVEEIVRMFIDQGLLVYKEDAEQHEICWHAGSYQELLSDLAVVGEAPDDDLMNMHYLLPLAQVPDTIQGVLAARVDLLMPTEKFVLQNAAIIGRTFWLSSLLELGTDMSRETIQEALSALIQRDFIVEGSKYPQQIQGIVEPDSAFTFKHILIRDVVYNNIPRTRRSQAHARLAFWLEEKIAGKPDVFTEWLAYHYQQALATWSVTFALNTPETNHGYDQQSTVECLTRSELHQRAIKYLSLAGDQAMHSYYTVRAIQAYNNALDLLIDNETNAPALCRMYIKLGDAHTQRANPDEAWQAYRKALQMIKEEGVVLHNQELAALYERLASLGTRWDDLFNVAPTPQEIRTYIDAGLRLSESQPMSRNHIAFLTYLALWHILQLKTAAYEQKTELVEQALASGNKALGFAEQLKNANLLSLVLDTLSFIYHVHHKYGEAHALQHRREKLADQLTTREELHDMYFGLGFEHDAIADYANAVMWFGRAWSLAQSMESPTMQLVCTNWRMRVWRQWDRWDEAYQVALETLRTTEQYQQDERWQQKALETLAIIAYRRGNQEEGDQHTRQYRRLIERQAEQQGRDCREALAANMHALHLAREDWQQAAASYKEKLRSSEPLPSPEVLATLAELMVATEESIEAQAEITERAIRIGEESCARKSQAIAWRARGRMYTAQHQWQKAEADLKRALQRFIDLDLPWEQGNTLYYLGILYKLRSNSYAPDEVNKRRDDLGRAHSCFEQALGFFEALQAMPSVQHVLQAMMQDTYEPSV